MLRPNKKDIASMRDVKRVCIRRGELMKDILKKNVAAGVVPAHEMSSRSAKLDASIQDQLCRGEHGLRLVELKFCVS